MMVELYSLSSSLNNKWVWLVDERHKSVFAAQYSLAPITRRKAVSELEGDFSASPGINHITLRLLLRLVLQRASRDVPLTTIQCGQMDATVDNRTQGGQMIQTVDETSEHNVAKWMRPLTTKDRVAKWTQLLTIEHRVAK